MDNKRTLGKVWPLACGLLLTAGARAQSTHEYPDCAGRPSEAQVEAAIGAFKAGKVAYEEGDRERAITYWEDAYRRDCTAHEMLTNLATAYELQGNRQQALIALETYLKRVPDSKKRDQVMRRVEQLRAQLESEAKQAAPASAAPAPGSPPAEARPERPSPERPPPIASERPRSDQAPSHGFPLGPVILMAGGAATAVVGAIIYADGQRDVERHEDVCGAGHRNCPVGYDVEAANSARIRATAGGAVALVGVGAVVGGLVWWLLSRPAEQPVKAGTRVLPASVARIEAKVHSGYAGIGLVGDF